jgi:hypothetical protein
MEEVGEVKELKLFHGSRAFVLWDDNFNFDNFHAPKRYVSTIPTKKE